MKLRKIFKRINKLIFEQKCIPWFLQEIYRVQKKYFQCRYNLIRVRIYDKGVLTKRKVDVTFVIPHRNCSRFLKLCIDSIHKYAEKVSYEIIVADDFSNNNEFNKIKELVNSKIRLYRFLYKKGHPFTLEWLYHRTNSPYVVTLDQDSILLSSAWLEMLDEFNRNEQLLIIGLRDYCKIRKSPQMVHPAFILINKKRCAKNLKPPLFFGHRPFYDRYEIGQKEPQHALSCKALAFSTESISYLDTYQTKYGFGIVGYHKNINDPIVYHQWYSGRIYTLDNADTIDDCSVQYLREAITNFFSDYEKTSLDMRVFKK